MVPREPTEEMYLAVNKNYADNHLRNKDRWRGLIRKNYQAMLAAAPAAGEKP